MQTQTQTQGRGPGPSSVVASGSTTLGGWYGVCLGPRKLALPPSPVGVRFTGPYITRNKTVANDGLAVASIPSLGPANRYDLTQPPPGWLAPPPRQRQHAWRFVIRSGPRHRPRGHWKKHCELCRLVLSSATRIPVYYDTIVHGRLNMRARHVYLWGCPCSLFLSLPLLRLPCHGPLITPREP